MRGRHRWRREVLDVDGRHASGLPSHRVRTLGGTLSAGVGAVGWGGSHIPLFELSLAGLLIGKEIVGCRAAVALTVLQRLHEVVLVKPLLDQVI